MEVPQWAEATSLDRPPTKEEVLCAIKCISSGKSPGADSIPPEIYKEGGEQLVQRLTSLFLRIWDKEMVPQDFQGCTDSTYFQAKRGPSLLRRPPWYFATIDCWKSSSSEFCSIACRPMSTSMMFCRRVNVDFVLVEVRRI